MFERYTEKARRAIFFGRYEASEFGSRSIETEHILLGILREEKVLVLRLLKLPTGSFEILRKEIEAHTVAGEKIPTSVDLPLSNESKRVLAYAAEEAERMAQKNIAGGHLLLGLLREEKCFAATLLINRGVTLATARQVVKDLEVEPSRGTSARPDSDTRSFDIADLGMNLTAQALEGTLPDLIGRESELAQVVQVLSRLTRGNPVLVGEPGVGKKSIVYGLAHRIIQCQIPTRMQNNRVISLDLGVIASGIKSRARLEDHLDTFLNQLLTEHTAVFFVEGLHTLAQTQRFLNVANLLKPALLLGSIRCISTASPAEYRKAVEAAPWLEELFTRIDVRPATESEAVEVLRGIKWRFEHFHGVTYSDEAIEYAVFHSSSHFPHHYLPEKAVDLIDEAAVYANLRQPAPSAEILELRKKAKLIHERHDAAIQNHEFEKARFYSDELRQEREKLKAAEDKYKPGGTAVIVGREEIEVVVAQRTGVSIDSLRRSRRTA